MSNSFWGNHLCCFGDKISLDGHQVLSRSFRTKTTQSTTAITSIVDSTQSVESSENLSLLQDSTNRTNNNSTNCVESSKNTIDSKLICTNCFPTRLGGASKGDSKQKFLPNTTIIALGANLKNPIATFKSLFLKLKQNAKIRILSTSPIYKNPPFGYANQPFFYNATMLLATSMCLVEFYAFIFYMERIFGRGRIRAFKNAPRTLDIDIIFFNDIFMRSKRLNIPHPEWRMRPSVLIPLAYQANYKGR